MALRTARRLRAVRLARTYSQYELAKMAGVARRTIRGMEEGRPTMPRTIRRVALALEVEPGLITDPEDTA